MQTISTSSSLHHQTAIHIYLLISSIDTATSSSPFNGLEYVCIVIKPYQLNILCCPTEHICCYVSIMPDRRRSEDVQHKITTIMMIILKVIMMLITISILEN